MSITDEGAVAEAVGVHDPVEVTFPAGGELFVEAAAITASPASLIVTQGSDVVAVSRAVGLVDSWLPLNCLTRVEGEPGTTTTFRASVDGIWRERTLVMTVRTFPSPTPLSPRWA